MSPAIIVSAEAHERLCALARDLREASGETVTFGDVVDHLLKLEAAARAA